MSATAVSWLPGDRSQTMVAGSCHVLRGHDPVAVLLRSRTGRRARCRRAGFPEPHARRSGSHGPAEQPRACRRWSRPGGGAFLADGSGEQVPPACHGRTLCRKDAYRIVRRHWHGGADFRGHAEVSTGGEFAVQLGSGAITGDVASESHWPNELEFAFRQPLVRGTGTETDTASVTITPLEERINGLALGQAVTDVATATIGRYRDYMRAGHRVAIQDGSLDRARELLAVNELLIRTGRTAERDIARTRYRGPRTASDRGAHRPRCRCSPPRVDRRSVRRQRLGDHSGRHPDGHGESGSGADRSGAGCGNSPSLPSRLPAGRAGHP